MKGQDRLLRYIQEGVICLWYFETGKDSIRFRVCTYGNIITMDEAMSIVLDGHPHTYFVRRWGISVDADGDIWPIHLTIVAELNKISRENNVALSLECTHNSEQ